MSIFFTQVISALLGFVLFAALNDKTKYLRTIFLPSFFGIVVGILIFKIARYALVDASVEVFFDCVGLFALFVAFIWIFFEFKPAKILTFFTLGACYAVAYSSASALFPLFAGELLDTQSVISFFLMLFAMILLVFLYFFILNLKDSISSVILKFLNILVLVLLIFEKMSITTLQLMRLGSIPTQSWLLSLVAKGIYVSSFSAYFYLFIIAVLAFLSFNNRPLLPNKLEVGSVAYRFVLAKLNFIISNAKSAFILSLISLVFMLYYDLYASRPPQISEPILVEPKDGKFRFDVEMLSDNKLHRYAYITDEGKEVRFFLLNRFADRTSPVIVFDACMICGDMGYVKRGNDLICIACNVRIFLPSVGKEGGCNPIVMPYKFDGKTIEVELDTILGGAGFFSKVVEKMVTDPVSRKKVSNLTSSSYLYYDRVYFFENNQTQAEFEANPQKYVDTNGTLK
ncbi:Fe-S-containing protein [Campylobacter mucosalis]|uniref:Ferrirhodotorulic acid ABC transporter, permease protein n=1 Tax=Campylobacter mucosalis CCUG 21559 TaxID=1032067 RepID=A0A6G5QEQ2_9BACT|nr:Fe-S-containing protein [Campylobacter mucosalis]QCD44175.1 ferrirhodotorulic acid ABC transporter, permease protein [Campylobacter mucosalis CCUG 21559]